ncbi:hypothetical protein GOBAR_AA06290 [Gossypium barbadense]|uniref:C-JID domain-containing protein n=1 Tax=Gossypium barbadense TaxID=3634 RepID=A0A2P5YFB5_GOSBA|nr:hypothetical protein GOBAR_AA06290 [Gossypium barbadense]
MCAELSSTMCADLGVELERPGLSKCRKLKSVPGLLTSMEVIAGICKFKRFDILIPGSEIPEWFNHQRVEFSIELSLPLNIRNYSQWMGIAFC